MLHECVATQASFDAHIEFPQFPKILVCSAPYRKAKAPQNNVPQKSSRPDPKPPRTNGSSRQLSTLIKSGAPSKALHYAHR